VQIFEVQAGQCSIVSAAIQISAVELPFVELELPENVA